MQRRPDKTGPTPSERIDEDGTGRPTDRAGKAGEQCDAGDGVTFSVAGIDAAAKPTPTVVVVPETTVALHAVPAQAPLNPVNDPLPLLTAFSVTAMPAANTFEQVPFATPAVIVQVMPSGTLVTLPLPLPNPLTARVPGACGM